MGALDSNGIWIYDENEDAAPFSTMLNRLGESVSDAVGPYVGDSGWQTLSVSSGWTVDEPLRCIKIGALVILQGVLSSASSGVTQNITTLPAGFAPTQAWRFAVYSGPAVTAERMTIQTSGVVQAPGNRTSKVYSISTVWTVL
jgi:hypothetical protein